jgi:hypothetical protein
MPSNDFLSFDISHDISDRMHVHHCNDCRKLKREIDQRGTHFNKMEMARLAQTWQAQAQATDMDRDGVTMRLSNGETFRVTHHRISVPATPNHEWLRGVMEHARTHWDGGFQTGKGIMTENGFEPLGKPDKQHQELRLLYRAYSEAFNIKYTDNHDRDYPLSKSELNSVPSLIASIRSRYNLPEPPAATTTTAQPPITVNSYVDAMMAGEKAHRILDSKPYLDFFHANDDAIIDEFVLRVEKNNQTRVTASPLAIKDIAPDSANTTKKSVFFDTSRVAGLRAKIDENKFQKESPLENQKVQEISKHVEAMFLNDIDRHDTRVKGDGFVFGAGGPPNLDTDQALVRKLVREIQIEIPHIPTGKIVDTAYRAYINRDEQRINIPHLVRLLSEKITVKDYVDAYEAGQKRDDLQYQQFSANYSKEIEQEFRLRREAAERTKTSPKTGSEALEASLRKAIARSEAAKPAGGGGRGGLVRERDPVEEALAHEEDIKKRRQQEKDILTTQDAALEKIQDNMQRGQESAERAEQARISALNASLAGHKMGNHQAAPPKLDGEDAFKADLQAASESVDHQSRQTVAPKAGIGSLEASLQKARAATTTSNEFEADLRAAGDKADREAPRPGINRGRGGMSFGR